MWKPSAPFNVPMKILTPVVTSAYGVVKKSYASPENAPLFFGAFRTFGGTEVTSNDLYTIEDTGVIDTWYRPDITPDCLIYICDSAATYEIISRPENIEMRNQYLQFRVRRVGGVA